MQGCVHQPGSSTVSAAAAPATCDLTNPDTPMPNTTMHNTTMPNTTMHDATAPTTTTHDIAPA